MLPGIEPPSQRPHVGAFNLSLVMWKLLGSGTPRELEKPLPSITFGEHGLDSHLAEWYISLCGIY